MKIFTDGKYHVDCRNGVDDIYKIIKSIHNADKDDVLFTYNEENNCWVVFVKKTTYEIQIGIINFDPYTGKMCEK